MAWVKIDDRFDEHPKLAAVGPVGWGVWLAGLAYANRNLTDGFIPAAIAESIGGRWRILVPTADGREKVWQIDRGCGDHGEPMDTPWIIDRLVDAGLWEHVPGGYRVHDYHDYQPSRAHVLAVREMRATAGRRGGTARGVRKPPESFPGKQSASKVPSKIVAKSYPVPVPVVDPPQRSLPRSVEVDPGRQVSSRDGSTIGVSESPETAGPSAEATRTTQEPRGTAGKGRVPPAPAERASARQSPGNGASTRAPALPGIDPGPDRRERAAAETRVWDAWRRLLDHPRAVLDTTRRRRIRWAIDTYGEDRAVAAIQGCAWTPWNNGDNPGGKRYDDVSLIFRDASHAERFLGEHDRQADRRRADARAAEVARTLAAGG